ncbi:MAG TPA: type II toxin-antitoxin system VapC family toxin [Pirellulales bacterium]|nr:type II toxin-antitoxin system VapC family toxin [Pirellulales bacterium]
MRLLLDTHVFLWYISGDVRLPAAFRGPIRDPVNDVFASLPIDEGAFIHLAKLPRLHRDPFDRMLVAQALQHDLTIATVDPAVRAYSVKLLPMT